MSKSEKYTVVICNYCKSPIITKKHNKMKLTGYLHDKCDKQIRKKALYTNMFGTQGKIALLEAITSVFRGKDAQEMAKPIVAAILNNKKFMRWLKTENRATNATKKVFKEKIIPCCNCGHPYTDHYLEKIKNNEFYWRCTSHNSDSKYQNPCKKFHYKF